ncbi:hypothetical protein QCA50_017141 [Cerrena zonata]|uniref:Major facilitator superfamily (MFS) profile domain-containing protein n=1 Tax=Cerrena zonata TaxID=2478898 RepID=A0AAW0FE31_9APHY
MSQQEKQLTKLANGSEKSSSLDSRDPVALQAAFKVSATTINATVSVFMAVFALAPLFWASWADFGGRKTLYLAFGVSSVMSVGAGTVADVVEPKNRAKAISYFMLGPQLGPILGPIFSLISSNGDWRWIFGFLAILGGIVFFLILFCLPETLSSKEGCRGKSQVSPSP